MSITSRSAIGDEQIAQIKTVMAGSPGINKTQLSGKLCELWAWRLTIGCHALSLVCRRLPDDWLAKYGRSVVLAETVVKRGKSRGTAFKAANRTCVGKTAGRGRNDRNNERALPQKDVYLMPLARRWRELLLSGKG